MWYCNLGQKFMTGDAIDPRRESIILILLNDHVAKFLLST